MKKKLYTIVRISSKVENRHGTPCRIGYTEDRIVDGTFYPSEIVYTENEELFDEFVVGLKVAL